jgi:hypothetical protein
MNWDKLDWNNFNCVEMQRQIRSKISEKREDMTIVEYLRKKKTIESHVENSKTFSKELYVSEKTENYTETDAL